MIIEGGITGYDTATRSGGSGMRVLGIGPQTQYSEDIITVSLRAVSVNTGSVLAAVNVQKTVYSTADSLAVLKFINDGTQVFELESGIALNEPATLAVKAAVDAAVVELIKEGERKDVWDFAD
jgi:curli production assembly/transport component CsgG